MVPMEDRSVLSEEEKQRRLQQLLLELAQKSEALPPGGPQQLIAQRTDHVRSVAAAGNVSAALRAAESLEKALHQVNRPDPLERVIQAPDAARTAMRVLETRVKEARAAGDPVELHKAETELKQAQDLAEQGRTDAIAQKDASDKINRLALERSAFGFDHLVLSTEARTRHPQAG